MKNHRKRVIQIARQNFNKKRIKIAISLMNQAVVRVKNTRNKKYNKIKFLQVLNKKKKKK